MKRIILSLATLVLLNGCASAYKVSPELEHLKGNLSRARALTIFHAALRPSENSVGICSHAGFDLNKGEQPKPTSDGFEYNAYKVGKFLRQEQRFGKTYNVYKKDFYAKQFKFADFTKVRIQVNNGAICSPSKGDYAIAVYNSFATFVIFDVVKQDLNPFLASISVLAPQAELIEGVGI